MFVSIDEIIRFYMSKNIENDKIKEKLIKLKNVIEYKGKLYLVTKDFEKLNQYLFENLNVNKNYFHTIDIFDLEKIKYLNSNEVKSKLDEIIDKIKEKNINEYKNCLDGLKNKSYIILDTEFDRKMVLTEIALKNANEEIYIKSENITKKLDIIKEYLDKVEVVFIHGADNDKIVLKKNGIDIDHKIIDTGVLVGKYFGESKKVSLEYLIDKFNINKYKDLHNALNDVNAVYCILKKIGVIDDN